MQQFDGTEHITMYHEPERTSIAAILGLVCSCIGCCFGVTAILGVVLSVFGIVGISRSKGRVGGMGFAIAGLLVGILMLALWGAALGGAMFVGKQMDANVVQPVYGMFGDLENDDFDSARSVLMPPASDATDAELIEFRDGYLAMLGPVVSTPGSFFEYVGQVMERGEPLADYQGANNMIPIPMQFQNGEGLVVIFFDQTQSGNSNGFPVPTDIIVFDKDGNEVSLPAKKKSAAPAADSDPDSDLDDGLPGVDVEDFSDETDEDVDEGP
ncbi:MAG: DUF4190 domain-containing protein [Phycisphaerales bacterium]